MTDPRQPVEERRGPAAFAGGENAESLTAELWQALESIAECVWSAEVDASGTFRYRYHSPVIERITGRPPAFFEGPDAWRSILHPDDVARMDRQVGELLNGQTAHQVADYRILRPDGSERWVRDSVAVVPVAGGLRLHGVMSDIHDAKTAEATIVRSEQRLRHLLESTAIVPWESDVASGLITYVGPQVVQLFGYPAERWFEKGFWRSIVHPDDRAWVVEFCEKTSREAASFDMEYRMIAAGGKTVWVQDVISVDYVDGAPATLRGFFIDVTERTRVETIRESAARRLRQIIDLAPDAIVAADPAGRIALVNQQAVRMFGYEPTELLGRRIEMLMPERFRHRHVTERLAYAEAPIARRMAPGHPHLVGRRKDGTEFPVAINLGSLPTDDGLLLVSSIRDVTHVRRIQAEAQEHRDALAHAARVSVLGELSAALAHELNQPLAAILSNAQAALRMLDLPPTDQDELRQILADIVEDDRRAGGIVTRLRRMMTKGGTQREAVSIPDAIHDVLNLFNSAFILDGIRVDSDVTPGLPDVSADRIQVQQVLINLLQNAVEAVRQREASRQVSVRARANGSSTILVSVTDNGPGIQGDRLERVFDPFYSSKPEGLGVGLAICRSLVTAHGGEIWAEPCADGGATLYFSLPVSGDTGRERA